MLAVAVGARSSKSSSTPFSFTTIALGFPKYASEGLHLSTLSALRHYRCTGTVVGCGRAGTCHNLVFQLSLSISLGLCFWDVLFTICFREVGATVHPFNTRRLNEARVRWRRKEKEGSSPKWNKVLVNSFIPGIKFCYGGCSESISKWSFSPPSSQAAGSPSWSSIMRNGGGGFL